VEEGVEAALLSPEVSFRWSGGARLEGFVHAFVATVLLGLAGLDELGKDAEADPPDAAAADSFIFSRSPYLPPAALLQPPCRCASLQRLSA
jgi:hypothetical protein